MDGTAPADPVAGPTDDDARSDDEFVEGFADELAGLPGVLAVTLGGSRAQGTARAGSDWDFGLYYRGRFDPQALRDLGHPGEVSELGGWGGGVFNGGAWLRVDRGPADAAGSRAVDVHFRDLDSIDHELAEAAAGRVHIEPLAFHLAGVPTYLVLGELAIARVLRGEPPRPVYPDALRAAAGERWWTAARMHLDYARHGHAVAGRAAQCLAMLTLAATQASHAVLAWRGEWVTNEKRLLDRAGLRGLDRVVTTVDPGVDGLLAACESVDSMCTEAMIAVRSAADAAR